MYNQCYPLEYYDFFIKFNEGDYYSCHDLLEEIWMTDKSNLYVKGLLHLCVALYHYSYGNVAGTRTMLVTAEKYLYPYKPFYWGVDLDAVMKYIHNCQSIIPQDIDRIPFSKRSSLPPLPELVLYLKE
ncbi:DUF309 domain-containing protein [Pseudalkalibacillus caeni]|uniref:DUF309 domain-containing protein n=1 Tax=Exobacillus caeni TaxID=2574798 RepID=A0A5R9FDA6_9BACL|nr:DUF309 domain-containing protein [Pseudalkalibacillus caeni]TLS38863.1 DUF309 domain-containing protein [Pseudalkalibacillus caeni]